MISKKQLLADIDDLWETIELLTDKICVLDAVVSDMQNKVVEKAVKCQCKKVAVKQKATDTKAKKVKVKVEKRPVGRPRKNK